MMEFDPSLMAAQVLTFLVALFLLWKIAFRPMSRLLAERADRIRNDVNAAQQAKEEAERIKTELGRQVSEMETRAQEALRKAVAEGQKAREELVQEARTQGRELLKKAEERMAIERDKVLKALRQDVIALAMEITEKVMAAKPDAEAHRRLADQTLVDLEKKGA